MSNDTRVPTITEYGPVRPLRELYFELGRTWLDQGEYREAAESFEQSLGQADSTLDDYEIRFCLAVALQRGGEDVQAFRTYLNVITDAPERVGDILPSTNDLLTRDTARSERERLLHGWAEDIQHTDLSPQDLAQVTFFLGRVNLYLEDYAKALRLFQDTVRVLPHDARVVEGLGESLWRTGDLEQALKTLNGARELAERGSHPERLAAIDNKIIKVLVDSERYEEALQRIGSRLENDDGYAYDLLLSRSRCYLRLDRAEEALEAASAASRRKATTVQAHLLRTRALIALGLYQEAVSAADQALQNNPSNRSTLLYKAQALIEGQIDLAKAQRLLRRYIDHTGADKASVYQVMSSEFATRAEEGNFHYFLAQLCRVLGDSEEALRRVDGALELGLTGESFPDPPAQQLKGELLEEERGPVEAAEWLFEAGRGYFWRSEYETAIDLLERAEEADRGHAATYWYLSEALRMSSYRPAPEYTDRDSLLRSLRIWKRGVEIEEPTADDSWVYVSRALISEQQTFLPEVDDFRGLWWEAVAYLERAILLNDADTFRWAYLGRYHRSLENESNALQATARALELDPEDATSLEERAAILANTGQFDEAREAIDKRRQLEPKNVWIEAVGAYVLLRVGEYDSALELINEAIEADPGSIWYGDVRGQCYKMLGRADSAAEEYGRIWSLYDPSNSTDRGTFAWAAYEAGEIDDAIRIYDEMSENDAEDLADVYLSLGICHLVKGDLTSGARELNEGIGRTINHRQLDDLLDLDFEPLERYSLELSHGAEVRKVLDQAREQIGAQRKRVRHRPSPEEELNQVIRDLGGTDERNNWPYIGAKAGLARLLGEQGQWGEAASLYLALSGESDRIPEARIGVQTAVTEIQGEGDRYLQTNRLDDAQERFAQALSLVPDSVGDQQEQRADLQCRLGYVHFELGDVAGARANFAQAVNLYEQTSHPDPGGKLGAVCGSLLENAVRYWALESDWEEWAENPETGEALRAHLSAARKSLAEYLNGLYQLSGRLGEPKTPSVAPIVLELGEGLIPEDTGPDWSLFATYLPQMRTRLADQMGVEVPGVRVRVGDLPPEGYLIMLDEIPYVGGSVDLLGRYCPIPPDALQQRGISASSLMEATNPLTGLRGSWVRKEDWDNVGGLELWDEPLAYVLYHLEAVLRRNLGNHNFVGVQNVEAMLQEWEQDEHGSILVKAALPDQASRLHFARLLRGLIREEVPITAWEDILEVVRARGLDGSNIVETLRHVRLRLKEMLPGNDPATQRIGLPAELEDTVASWLRHENGKARFVAPPQGPSELRAAIRGLARSGDRSLALVTRSSELRPFLRRLIEFEFPYLIVLSEDELLPHDRLAMKREQGGEIDG